MNTYFLAIGILGAFLLNIIASVTSKDWSFNIAPKTKLGRVIVQTYIVATVILALLYLLEHIRASWCIAFCIGGQIVWQLYTATYKMFPTMRSTTTRHKWREGER